MEGCPAGLLAEPAKWHWAQTAALEGSVVACVKAEVPLSRQGFGGCGALTPWQVLQALAEAPPVKFAPWQS